MSTKNFLIVGGSYGIGQAIVTNLAKQGHHVYVIARTRGELPDLHNITHIKNDAMSEDLDLSALPEVVDGFVYSIGSINLKPFRTLKTEDFLKDFNINVLGAVKILKSIQKQLKKSEQASVVLFSTVAVQQGMPFHASVAAAKGAVEGLTRSLAAEWAPKIRVNCIAPSLTDTPLAARLLATPEKKEAAGNRHPLKRVGTAEELGNIAAFLLSDKSTWITGQVIGVDGGLSALKV